MNSRLLSLAWYKIKLIEKSQIDNKSEILSYFSDVYQNAQKRTVNSLAELKQRSKEEELYLNFVGNYDRNDEIYLPDEIAEYQNITSIDCSFTKIQNLAPIFQLKNLKYLDLTCINGNEEVKSVLELPNEIGNLQELFYLSCWGNKMKSLPQQLIRLKKLAILYLTQTEIEFLPNEIYSLRNLVYLHLANCELSQLDDRIANLHNLVDLHLSSNKLTYLPSTIGDLKYLYALNLSRNNLSELPKSIGKLANLEILEINNNKLVGLPFEITHCTRIRNLNIEDNSLNSFPQLKDTGIIEAFSLLNKKNGVYNYYTSWDIPNEIAIYFQQYLNYFPKFVKDTYNKDLDFSVDKSENRLSLAVKTSRDLSVDEINQYLKHFIDFLKYKTTDLLHFINNQDYSDLRKIQMKNVVLDLDFEKQHLVNKITYFNNKSKLLELDNEQKSKIIDDLVIRVNFFQNQVVELIKLSTINAFTTQVPQTLLLHYSQAGKEDKKVLSDIRVKAIKLIEKGNILECINTLKYCEEIKLDSTICKTLIIQASLYNDVKMRYDNNLINYDDFTIKKNKISSNLIELINEI